MGRDDREDRQEQFRREVEVVRAYAHQHRRVLWVLCGALAVAEVLVVVLLDGRGVMAGTAAVLAQAVAAFLFVGLSGDGGDAL